MKKAAQVGEQTGLPLYIHFGQLWPEPTPAARHVDTGTAIFPSGTGSAQAGDVLGASLQSAPGRFVSHSMAEIHPFGW